MDTSDWTMSELFYSPNTGTRCLTPPLRLWFRYSFQSQGLKTRLCDEKKIIILKKWNGLFTNRLFTYKTFCQQDLLPMRNFANKNFFLQKHFLPTWLFPTTIKKMHLTNETFCQHNFFFAMSLFTDNNKYFLPTIISD